jgi:NAD(P)-dependent dehydrogenase (short-subunit alcohol dehydrogenase family)
MTDSEQTSVLITGGNKGLGFEAARRLGEQGWTILLGSRDESRGRAAANKLTDGGGNVVMVPLDVTVRPGAPEDQIQYRQPPEKSLTANSPPPT